jgi:hypothetical protein
MIVCPVCNSDNGHLSVVCVSCGSYLQSKVDNLDLFSTAWQLIESPKKAFRRIAIANHKNYTVVLAAIAGIGLAFSLMWMLNVGNSEITLLQILAMGFVLGPIVGILHVLVIAVIQDMISRFMRLKSRYRNVFAVISYASVPICLSVIFLLPIEILSYGKYFFSTNPSPYTIKPLSYVFMLGLDVLFVGWTLALYVIGVRVLYDIKRAKALTLAGLTLILYFAIVSTSVIATAWDQTMRSDEKVITNINR